MQELYQSNSSKGQFPLSNNLKQIGENKRGNNSLDATNEIKIESHFLLLYFMII